MVRPWLARAARYDRVSGYYSPRTLLSLLAEFAKVWDAGGTVRLVLGYHETRKILPAVRGAVPPDRALKRAVGMALLGQADELGRLLHDDGRHLIPSIRQLLEAGALHVRLVTPRVNFEHYQRTGSWPEPEIGLFHSKFAVFRLGSGRVPMVRRQLGGYYRPVRSIRPADEPFAVVSGSFNETDRGYGENIEDAVLHRSWVDGEGEIASYFAHRFEDLWLPAAPDIVSMPFDEEFVGAIEAGLERAEPRWFSWKAFSNLLTTSPIYGNLAFEALGLLPHQRRVYLEALRRWPVRAMLADEVGLGKTIEAGSIIKYLLDHGKVKRVLILTPASLRGQWQRQLLRLFGLGFWVYDSAGGVCRMHRKERPVSQKPLNHVPLVIASWHWARSGASAHGSRLDGQTAPDLLVVDESHHARIHVEEGGGLRFTLLHHLVGRLAARTPHILLLTATPFQTAQLDYYSQLQLLGLPDWFTSAELARFASWCTGRLPDIFAMQVQRMQEVRKTAAAYALSSYPRATAMQSLSPDAPSKDFESVVLHTGPLKKEEYLLFHPTALLTLRNTRIALKAQGYDFPKAELSSAGIQVSEEQGRWLNQLDTYVQSSLGSVESVTNSHGSVGRLKSQFRQRAVSSIRAAKDSLMRRGELLREYERKKQLRLLKDTLGPDFDPSESEEEGAGPAIQYTEGDSQERSAQSNAATHERIQVEQLLISLDAHFAALGKDADPKMDRVHALVEEHLAEDRSILVFSRFTSTTSAVIDALADIAMRGIVGRYDGHSVGIYGREKEQLVLHECERQQVESALKTKRIRVMVCSDAASEGLDLQTASVVINVDVPWNPSRLLQRFGRVDRLGQKAKEVHLINAYYPGSIEERMYQVLEDRRLDGVAVLGGLPEILSEQQQRFVEALGAGHSARSTTLAEVEAARASNAAAQFEALSLRPGACSQLDDLLRGFIKAAAAKDGATHGSHWVKDLHGTRLSVDPLDVDFISWAQDSWSLFENPRKQRGLEAEVAALETAAGSLLGIVLVRGLRCYPLPTSRWVALFDFLFSGRTIPLRDAPSFPRGKLVEMVSFLQEQDAWILADHCRMSTISPVRPPLPNLAPNRLRRLGRAVRIAT
jgi:ERCC4-related helicase